MLHPDKHSYIDYQPILEQRYYNRLLQKIDYLPEQDQEFVRRAALFMMSAFHQANVSDRDNGEPAASHPIESGIILAEMKLPAQAIAIALNHDDTEDTEITLDQLSREFGPFIADGIKRISKVKELPLESQDNELRANLFEATIEHPMAALARFAERLHNLRTISGKLKKNRPSAENTAEESMRVYGPLLWKLGLYDMSNEVVARSLAARFPDQFEIQEGKKPSEYKLFIHGANLPAFDQNNQKKITRLLNKLIEIKPSPTEVYPPNLNLLAELMLVRKDIRKIEPEECPLIVDVDVVSDEEIMIIAARLIKSRMFYPVGKSGTKLLSDIESVENKPRYLHLTPKDRLGDVPTPLVFNFYNSQMKNQRRASIVDLYRVDVEAEEKTINFAQEKIDDLAAQLQMIKSGIRSKAQRADIYEAAVIKGEIIFPIVIIDGNPVGELPVLRKSTLLEIATNPDLLEKYTEIYLSQHPDLIEKFESKPDFSVHFELFERIIKDYIIRIKNINMNGKARSFTHPVTDRVQIDIETSTDIEVRPFWLRAIADQDSLARRIISEELVELVSHDGGIRQDALNIGEDIIKRLFREQAHIAKSISIVHGYDDQLREKYGNDKEAFLVDVGIGIINEDKFNEVVNNMVRFYNSLIPIHIYIPPGGDKPGYESNCAAVLGKLGLNIVVIQAGETDRNDTSSEIIYLINPELRSVEELSKLMNDVVIQIPEALSQIWGNQAIPKIEIELPEAN